MTIITDRAYLESIRQHYQFEVADVIDTCLSLMDTLEKSRCEDAEHFTNRTGQPYDWHEWGTHGRPCGKCGGENHLLAAWQRSVSK